MRDAVELSVAVLDPLKEPDCEDEPVGVSLELALADVTAE